MGLKPCPFCGDEASLVVQYGKYGYFAFCECFMCTARSKTFFVGRDLPSDWDNTIAARRAVAAWNRRCTDAEQDN